jgi:hypothetical protein
MGISIAFMFYSDFKVQVSNGTLSAALPDCNSTLGITPGQQDRSKFRSKPRTPVETMASWKAAF